MGENGYDKENACFILGTMASGIDPVTGEILPYDHLCNYPEVTAAIRFALTALESGTTEDLKPDNQKREKPNAGRPWTEEDLDKLDSLYRAGVPMEEICRQLQRRERGVQRQLAYLGHVESEVKAAKKTAPGLARAGLPWMRQEDIRLREMYEQKCSVQDMAAELQRSDYSIYCRLERLGLYGEEYGYPAKDDQGQWNPAVNKVMKEMFQKGKSVEEIAQYFGKKEKTISARLFYMGLIHESPLPKLR